jgi:hypothetical protein
MLQESKIKFSAIDTVHIVYSGRQERIYQRSLVFQSPENRIRNVNRRENTRSRDHEW